MKGSIIKVLVAKGLKLKKKTWVSIARNVDVINRALGMPNPLELISNNFLTSGITLIQMQTMTEFTIFVAATLSLLKVIFLDDE